MIKFTSLLISVWAILFVSSVRLDAVDWPLPELSRIATYAFEFSRTDEDFTDLSVAAVACTENFVKDDYIVVPLPTPDGELESLRIRYQENTYSLIGLKLYDPIVFSLSWEIEVLSTQKSSVPLQFSLLETGRKLPDGVSLTLSNASSVIDLTPGTQFEIAPGTWTFTAECALCPGVSIAYKLAPGWNLIGIPFQRVTDSGELFNYTVYRGTKPPVLVNDLEDLTAGTALWVYNSAAETAVVTLTGDALTERPTIFGYLHPGWNAAALIGQYAEKTGTWQPAIEEKPNSWTWNNARSSLVLSDGNVVGTGYFVNQEP